MIYTIVLQHICIIHYNLTSHTIKPTDKQITVTSNKKLGMKIMIGNTRKCDSTYIMHIFIVQAYCGERYTNKIYCMLYVIHKRHW